MLFLLIFKKWKCRNISKLVINKSKCCDILIQWNQYIYLDFLKHSQCLNSNVLQCKSQNKKKKKVKEKKEAWKRDYIFLPDASDLKEGEK